MFQDYRLAVVLTALIIALVAATHALRIAPIGKQWRWVWITMVFLLWLLAGFRSVRAL